MTKFDPQDRHEKVIEKHHLRTNELDWPRVASECGDTGAEGTLTKVWDQVTQHAFEGDLALTAAEHLLGHHHKPGDAHHGHGPHEGKEEAQRLAQQNLTEAELLRQNRHEGQHERFEQKEEHFHQQLEQARAHFLEAQSRLTHFMQDHPDRFAGEENTARRIMAEGHLKEFENKLHRVLALLPQHPGV